MISSVSYHGANLRYSDLGKGNPVVLIHGYLESLEIWNGFAEKLAKSYRVISVDLPGHGQSGIYSSMNTMAVMADSVKAVLDHLSIGRAVFIGHSMGGKAAMQFALKYPGQTLKLIIIDIANKVYPPFNVDLIDALISLDVEDLTSLKQADGLLRPRIPDMATRRFLLKNLKRNQNGQCVNNYFLTVHLFPLNTSNK